MPKKTWLHHVINCVRSLVDELVVNDPRVFNISLAVFHITKLTEHDALPERQVLGLDINPLSSRFLIKISKTVNKNQQRFIMSADSGTKTGDTDNAYEAELERPVTVDYGETKVTKPQPLPAAAVCFPLISRALKIGEKSNG